MHQYDCKCALTSAQSKESLSYVKRNFKEKKKNLFSYGHKLHNFFFALPPLPLFPLNVSPFGHKKAEEIILNQEGFVFKSKVF